MALRQKYNIPLEEVSREYFVVQELPYGQQAQADFGHYILRSTEDRRKRIYFFVMMLSRSRMKFVQFSDAPFTTRMTIDAHEEAFKFFCGMPLEVVYDQDRLLLQEERMGELLLTQEFKDYVFEQEFQLHFCKKHKKNCFRLLSSIGDHISIIFSKQTVTKIHNNKAEG